MNRLIAMLVVLVAAVGSVARADLTLVTERGLHLCDDDCVQIAFIDILDRSDVTLGLNPAAGSDEGISIGIRRFYPELGWGGPVKVYHGSVRPPSLLVWSPVSGDGYFRGSVTSEMGGTCDLRLDWWAAGGGAPLVYSADSGAVSAGRVGEWPLKFYASSQACGLGGSSFPEVKGYAWERRELSVEP